MTRSSIMFAEKLTEGILQIRFREGKTISAIQDELGYALGKQGGSSIEYWRKGHVPAKLPDLITLAREIVKRGQLEHDWLEEFLRCGGHPAPQVIVDTVFPAEAKALAQVGLVQPTAPPEVEQPIVALPLGHIPEPAPLPSNSLMPLSRNPLFVGREADLRALAAALQSNKAMTISQVETAAATGLGGLGKTQLACEFVHRYGQFFVGGVFWLSFDNGEAVPAEIAACGDVGALNLHADYGSRTLDEQVKLVQAAWQSPLPRLLVFDNCEDPALLTQWRPPTGGSRVIITSRRGDWEIALGVQTLALGVLSRVESLTLLQKHCPDVEEVTLGAIAEELGDLPLALHLAGHYLSHYRRIVTPADYLKELQDPLLLHHPSMQGEGLSPTGHVQQVGRTFALSYDQLNPDIEADALARKLLVHAAHFAPGEPIWYKLLVQTLTLDSDDPMSPVRAEQAFQRLIDVGLIEIEQDQVLRMHRLVAKFVRDVAKDEVEVTQQAVEAVVFSETAQINEAGFPMPLLAWQLHLRSVVDVAQIRKDLSSAKLCLELGEHLWQIGDYEGALPYYQQALSIRESLLGKDHLDTADCLNQLGRTYNALSKSPEALDCFERALAIQQGHLAEDNAAIAKTLNFIGLWHLNYGEVKTAQNYFERALNISYRVFEDDHSATAEYENNVGECLRRIGDLDAALPYLLRALDINRRIRKDDHITVAMNLNNIALTLQYKGQLSEARSYYEQAIAACRKVHGNEHALTALYLNNLGNLLRDLGELDAAKIALEESLTTFDNLFSEPHILTAFCLNNLGLVYQHQGELDLAKVHLERALAIREALLTGNHILKALSLKNLGLLLILQQDLVFAQDYLRQALNIYEANLEHNHTDIQAVRDVLLKLKDNQC